MFFWKTICHNIVSRTQYDVDNNDTYVLVCSAVYSFESLRFHRMILLQKEPDMYVLDP